MKELHSEVEIKASAERVWQVLTNFAAFPQWNPFIRMVSGETRVGQRSGTLGSFRGNAPPAHQTCHLSRNANVSSTSTRKLSSSTPKKRSLNLMTVMLGREELTVSSGNSNETYLSLATREPFCSIWTRAISAKTVQEHGPNASTRN